VTSLDVVNALGWSDRARGGIINWDGCKNVVDVPARTSG